MTTAQNTKKIPFAQLNDKEKAARLAEYKAQRAQYNLIEGLFNVTAIADHGEIQTKNGTCHKFGYRVVAAGNNNEEGLKPGNFFWMNELVNVRGNATKIVALRQSWKKRLSDKSVKSITMAINYKKNGAYRDVHDMHERSKKNA